MPLCTIMHPLHTRPDGLERFTDSSFNDSARRYRERPKQFAAPYYEDLRLDAEKLRFSPVLWHQVMAASAYNEAAIASGVVPPHDPQFEEQYTWLKNARSLLSTAVPQYQAKFERGELEQPSEGLRAELDLITSPLYEATATGKLTQEVKLYAHKDLCDFMAKVERQHDEVKRCRLTPAQQEKAASDIRGFGMEIIALLLERQGDQANQITLPASYRGDNGSANTGHVHDLTRLSFNDQWELIPPTKFSNTTEVKTKATERDRIRTKKAGMGLRDMSNLPDPNDPRRKIKIIWDTRHLLLDSLTDRQAYSAHLDRIYADQP